MTARTTILLAAGALALAACDPRAFDDLADTTWVDSTGAPGGMDSNDYVVGLTWTDTGNTAGAELIVAGDAPASVGIVRYAADGGGPDSSGRRVTDAFPLQTDVNFASRPPPIAGAPSAIDGAGIVAVGMPEEEDDANPDRTGVVILLSATSQFDAVAQLGPLPMTNDLGAELSFADTDYDPSGSARADVIATAGNEVVLFPDVLNTGTSFDAVKCAISPNQAHAHAVIAADVTDDSPGQEVLIAGGDVSPGGTAGSIFVVAGSDIEAADAAADGGRCFDTVAIPPRAPLVEIEAPNGEPDFGVAMVAGNFNGSGPIDLAVAAPGSGTIYVYLDLNFDTLVPPVDVPVPLAIAAPADSVAFAWSMAAGDLGGDGADELAVGDPEFGADRSGRAYLYQLDGGQMSLAATLYDVDPESNQEFGRAVLLAPFGTSGDHVLAVATAGELFTYFQTTISGDVR